MKRLFCLLLAMSMLLALCACSKPADKSTKPTAPTEPDDRYVLDYFEALDMMFFGNNGEGCSDVQIHLDYICYDHDNTQLYDFLRNVQVSFKREGLRNGEALQVTLSYSEDVAKQLGVRLKADSKVYIVTGLNGDDALTSMTDVHYDAMQALLDPILREGETVVAAYGVFSSQDNKKWGQYKVVSHVVFVVTNGTLCYGYSVAVNGEGDPVGDFHRLIGRSLCSGIKTVEAVYDQLCEQWGVHNVEELALKRK